jgi:glycosyltransferase involved in cell wall biosynthesis
MASADKRMKVLHVGKFYPPSHGGMETHLALICKGLQRDWSVNAVVANECFSTVSEVIDGVNVTRVASFGRLCSTAVSPAMVKAIRRCPAEIVHLHWPNPTAVVSYLASGHNGKVLVTYHSDVVRQKLLGKVFEPLLDKVLQRASAVIVTTPRYLDSSPVLRKIHTKCRIIPFGIPTGQYEYVDRDAVGKIKSEFGPRIILSVGRYVYYKGFEYLIAAMERVNGRALIIGDGPLRNPLQKLVKDLGLQDRVTLLTDVEDVVPYYQAAEMFVLPSTARSEAFGIVQLEAMACSRPVINTSIDSGVPYISVDGVTGVTVPPRDAPALADAMNLLLDNTDIRTQYGRAARHRLETEFSLDSMVNRTLDLYDEVLAKKKVAPLARTSAAAY